jgi:hypothetical protein
VNRSRIAGSISIFLCATAALAQPPQIPFWSGRTPEKSLRPAATMSPSQSSDSKSTPQESPAEPEWLERLSPDERTTLTGGWPLQNWSGGSHSLTTAGDREGPYAPNTYQGSQFRSWHNLTTRQELPSWNGTPPTFPPALWSQGYVSPNSYFGAEAQAWGNMSPGTFSPNVLTGGWTMWGR